jgi:superfamily II DNA or RNA helicase
MLQAFAKGTLKYIISTYVFRQGCNFPDLQVLIRADGATSEVMGIQIPGRVARLAEGKKFAYLIDVDDVFDSWAEGRAKKRKELYDKQKWIPISKGELLDDLSTRDAESLSDDIRDITTEETESGEDNITAQ